MQEVRAAFVGLPLGRVVMQTGSQVNKTLQLPAVADIQDLALFEH